MSPLFDAYIMVDWSASSKPQTGVNSIWIGCLSRTSDGSVSFTTSNPATRFAAEQELAAALARFAKVGRRVLLGFDFAFGYPSGTARALGLGGADKPAWQSLHEFISQNIGDSEDNSNTRFAFAAELNARLTGSAHPFWGVPSRRQKDTLHPRKGDFARPDSLPEHRLAESWIRDNFQGSPKSVWQLAYIGSVGSQALLGIPTLTRLRQRRRNVRIWPFETGLKSLTDADLNEVHCLIAEIYPSILTPRPQADEVKDAAQIRALAHHFASADSEGRLATAFSGDNSLSTGIRAQIEQEEGWILAI